MAGGGGLVAAGEGGLVAGSAVVEGRVVDVLLSQLQNAENMRQWASSAPLQCAVQGSKPGFTVQRLCSSDLPRRKPFTAGRRSTSASPCLIILLKLLRCLR